MVRFGLQLPHDPIDLILESALLAEKLGFDSVFTPDHLVGIGIRQWDAFEAFTVLGAISKLTERVKLGTCVSDVLRKHPAVIAQSAMTLDHLSGGRAILSLGAGEGMNLIPYGIPTNYLVSKLEEGTEIIKKLLGGGEVTHNGRFFRLERAFIRPKPSGHIPVWIAGNSPKTMLLTAKLGDGWVPTASMGPEGYRENLRMIREHARKSGRSGQEIEAALFAYIVVEDSYEEARKRIELPGRVVALLSPLRRKFLEKVGIDENELGFPHLMDFTFNENNVSKLLDWAKRIPFEIVEDRYIFGSPDDVIDRLSKFAEAGAQHFVLTPLVQHKYYLDTVRRIADKVMSYFKNSEGG
jgi:phthiodiolone/phenolphthiodiolone dimycocerosates ketoreductase